MRLAFYALALICLSCVTADAQQRRRALLNPPAGGATQTWYDIATEGEADQEAAVFDTMVWQAKTLGAGRVTRYRFLSGATFSGAANVGFALYDNGGTLVANSAATVSVTSGGAYFIATVASPPTIGAGDYHVAFNVSANTITTKYKLSGATRSYDGQSYASFPPASTPTPDGSDAAGHAVSVEVTNP